MKRKFVATKEETIKTVSACGKEFRAIRQRCNGDHVRYVVRVDNGEPIRCIDQRRALFLAESMALEFEGRNVAL